MSSGNVEILFTANDQVRQEDVDKLLADLSQEGDGVQVTQTYPPVQAALGTVLLIAAILITTASSAASVAIIAAFIYRVFRVGIALDLTGNKPIITREPNLPRGNVLIRHADGKSELREGLDSNSIAALIKAVVGKKLPSGQPDAS